MFGSARKFTQKTNRLNRSSGGQIEIGELRYGEVDLGLILKAPSSSKWAFCAEFAQNTIIKIIDVL